MQEVIDRLRTGCLTIEDARSATRVAGLHIAISFQVGPGAGVDRIHRRPVG